MTGRWHTVTVGETADLITKGTTPTSVGGHFLEQGVKFVKVESIKADGRVDFDRLAHIDEHSNALLARSVLKEDDVLFTIAGTIGRVALVARNLLPANTNQAVAIVRPNRGVVVPRFLYYALREESRVKQAHTRVVQSVQANFSLAELGSLEIPLPELDEQHAIACVLGSLDDKIELNRRMNETLEAIARAMFRSWFVDLSPVRAKAAGKKPYGLDKETAALFPDSFEDSEFGEIPRGWRVGRLDEILEELVAGARPKGGATNEGVPSIGAENVIGLGLYDFSREKFIPSPFFEQLKVRGAAARPGDVLLYKDGAQVGRKTYIDCGFPHAECAVNEHVFILRANKAEDQRFLYFWLDQGWMTDEIISLNSNSAQPGINQGGVRRLPILIPGDEAIKAFDQLTMPLMHRLFANCNESRTLSMLRDTLLPKLLSGEIRVNGFQ